jgi:hypothetical protein
MNYDYPLFAQGILAKNAPQIRDFLSFYEYGKLDPGKHFLRSSRGVDIMGCDG